MAGNLENARDLGAGIYTQAEVDAGYTPKGFKNYIINGGFDVWQRGTSQSAGGYRSADRWQIAGTASGYLVSRSTDTPEGYSYSTHLTNTSGSLVWRQRIENLYATNANTTFTLSCYVKVISGSVSIDITDGGITSTSSSSWTKISTTVTSIGGALSPNGYIDIGISGAGEAYVTGVQLEEGSVATPFEHRPYGLELSLCQRYYENKDVYSLSSPRRGTSTTLGGGSVSFANKRVTPSIDTSGITFNGHSLVSSNITVDMWKWRTDNLPTGVDSWVYGNLRLDAEL